MALKRIVLGVTVAALLFSGAVMVLATRMGSPSDVWVFLVAGMTSLGLLGLPAFAAAYLREKGVWRPVMLAVILTAVLDAGLTGGTFVLLEGSHVSAMPVSAMRQNLERWMPAAAVTAALWVVLVPIGGAMTLVSLHGWARRVPLTGTICWFLWGLLLTIWWGGDIVIGWPPYYVDDFIRMVTAGLTVVFTLTLGTAWLYHRQKQERLTAQALTSLDLAITCPRCGCEQTVRPGHSRCRQCRLKFHIQVEEPRCPKCNYVLHMLTRPICPECGASLGQDEIIGSHEA